MYKYYLLVNARSDFSEAYPVVQQWYPHDRLLFDIIPPPKRWQDQNVKKKSDIFTKKSGKYYIFALV